MPLEQLGTKRTYRDVISTHRDVKEMFVSFVGTLAEMNNGSVMMYQWQLLRKFATAQ